MGQEIRFFGHFPRPVNNGDLWIDFLFAISSCDMLLDRSSASRDIFMLPNAQECADDISTKLRLLGMLCSKLSFMANELAA